MQKTKFGVVQTIILILLICFPSSLFAQWGDDSDIDEWEDFTYDLYVRGDQIFIISFGTFFPGFFIRDGELIDPQFTPPVGGVGSLAYVQFLSPHFFIGGELTGMFIHTLRGHTLFVVPLGLRAGTHFIRGRFEFPLFLSLGMTWQTYLDYGYYGFYMKATGGAFFRATSQWSFGLHASFGWFPQWTGSSRTNVDGTFANIMLAARYHF